MPTCPDHDCDRDQKSQADADYLIPCQPAEDCPNKQYNGSHLRHPRQIRSDYMASGSDRFDLNQSAERDIFRLGHNVGCAYDDLDN